MKNSTKIIIITATLGLIALNHFYNEEDKHEKIILKKAKSIKNYADFDSENAYGGLTENIADSQDVETTGEALIGGDFELTDQNGNKFTQENLKDKYSLVYFGFTHCPMICPTALSSISLTMEKLGQEAEKFQPVFITTDPERDTQERLKEYLVNFNSNIIGLTGSEKELEKAKKAYKVYAEKSGITKDGGYDMNHSSIIYVMNKQGKYISHFTHASPVDEIISKLKTIK
ncbi:MAG: SCO family protein [Rickettsiales bacterium]|nr:SCO family protein [Rickettsiales bacterium]